MPLRYLAPLRTCSIVFVSLPWFIFFATWMRPAWAVVMMALLLYLLIRYASARTEPRADGAPDGLPGLGDGIPARSLLVLVLVALAWVSLSGAGGVGLQNLPDWNNKNVLMNDLVRYGWPVVYDNNLILNYYFALYLPPTAVGHLLGWNAAQWVLYAEVLAGTVLALLWLYSYAGRLGLKAPLLFLAFGGLDIVGFLATRHHLPQAGAAIEWWTTGLQFSSMTTTLFWVPQHCLPGWILTSLILDEAARRGRVAHAGLFVGLCLLWSPFVTLGLVPVAVAAWTLAERKSVRSVANLVFWPVITVLALALYLPHKSGGDLDAGPAAWSRHYAPDNLIRMAGFLALEVGVYGLVIAACWSALDRRWRTVALIAAVASICWVLVPESVGHGGFTMRSSIPTLVMLFLLVVQVLSLTTHRRARLALGICLALGSVSAVQEVTRSVQRYPAALPAPRPAEGVLDLNDRHRNEFVMPMNTRLYRLFYRTPGPPPR